MICTNPNCSTLGLVQIIHNLLSNVLKHGVGDLIVRVRRRGGLACLTIAHSMERARAATSTTSGLGLRVVGVLVRLDPQVRFQRRQAASYYLVRMLFMVSLSGERPVRESAGAVSRSSAK